MVTGGTSAAGPLRPASERVEDVDDQGDVTRRGGASPRDGVGERPQAAVVVVESRDGGRDRRVDRVRIRIRRRERRQHRAQQLTRVPLDAARADGHRRLAGEDGRQLDVAQAEAGVAAPVEHLEHADRAAVVDQRHGEDRARHVARPLGRRPVEARIGRDVADHQRLAGREHVAGDALAGRDGEPDGALARRPGRDADHEPVGRRIVERDRRGLRVEQRHGRIRDRPQDGLARRGLEAAGNGGARGDGLQGPEQTVVGRLVHQPKS